MNEYLQERFGVSTFEEYEKKNAFMGFNNIHVVEVTEDYAIVKHVMTEDSVNLSGNCHGGLMMTMMDVGAALIVRMNGMNAATNTMTSTFFKPGHGTIYSKAEFQKKGRRISVIHAWCYNEDGTILSDSVINLCSID